MSDGHFRSLQPWNGQGLHEKSASKKVLIFKKSRVKIPLVMGVPLKKASRNSTDSKCYFSEMSSRKKKLWQSKALSRTNSGHWAVLHPIPVQCFRQFWKKNIEIAGLYRLSTKKLLSVTSKNKKDNAKNSCYDFAKGSSDVLNVLPSSCFYISRIFLALLRSDWFWFVYPCCKLPSSKWVK